MQKKAILGIVSILVVSLVLLFILDSVGIPLGKGTGYQPAQPIPSLMNGQDFSSPCNLVLPDKDDECEVPGLGEHFLPEKQCNGKEVQICSVCSSYGKRVTKWGTYEKCPGKCYKHNEKEGPTCNPCDEISRCSSSKQVSQCYADDHGNKMYKDGEECITGQPVISSLDSCFRTMRVSTCVPAPNMEKPSAMCDCKVEYAINPTRANDPQCQGKTHHTEPCGEVTLKSLGRKK